MTTTPNLGIQLLDGAAPNDWRDINQALEDVDGAAATPASVATEVATAISAHEGAPDPHPAYLTAGEADALFLTPAEGDARYAAIGGGGGGGLATDPLADAKGDLFAASGADAVGRLALGTNGQVLTADPAQSLGVKWATPAAAGMSDPTTTTGDLIVRGSSDPYAYLVPLATPGGPGASDSSPYEFGYEFSCSTAKTVTGIGWYRVQASSAKPSALRLWDTTATSSAVIAVTSGGSITDNGAAGWQFTDVSALGYTLVAGRHYRVSYTHTVLGGERCSNLSGIPGTPDSGITGYGVYFSTTPGAYPNSSHSVYFGSNIRLGSGAAGTGATRLPVGTTGQVLTADSAQTLGVKWAAAGGLSQADADLRYLQLVGGTLSGNLGVGAAATARLSVLATSGNALEVKTGTAPGTTRLQVAQSGTVTLTPDAGQAAVIGTLPAGGQLQLTQGALSAANFRLQSAQSIELHPGTGYVLPQADNGATLGHASYRWAALYAVSGTINTSLAEAKQDITPLSPEDALAAVRATDPVVFDYRPPERPPEWYELPDDPEQAAQVLEQRLTAAPLEEGARHQAGFVLHDESGTYATDPLFETGEGQSNAANSVGILLAAVKALDARLVALEGA